MKTKDNFEVELRELHVVPHVPGYICGHPRNRNPKALEEYTKDIPSYDLEEGPYKMNVIHRIPDIDLQMKHLPTFRVTMYLSSMDKVVGGTPPDLSCSHLYYVCYIDKVLNVTKEFVENEVSLIIWKDFATNWDY